MFAVVMVCFPPELSNPLNDTLDFFDHLRLILDQSLHLNTGDEGWRSIHASYDLHRFLFPFGLFLGVAEFEDNPLATCCAGLLANRGQSTQCKYFVGWKFSWKKKQV